MKLKCPQCGAEIWGLNYVIVEQEIGFLDNEEYDNDNSENEILRSEFTCPVCDEVLFRSMKEAEKFVNFDY